MFLISKPFQSKVGQIRQNIKRNRIFKYPRSKSHYTSFVDFQQHFAPLDPPTNNVYYKLTTDLKMI